MPPVVEYDPKDFVQDVAQVLIEQVGLEAEETFTQKAPPSTFPHSPGLRVLSAPVSHRVLSRERRRRTASRHLIKLARNPVSSLSTGNDGYSFTVMETVTRRCEAARGDLIY